MTGGDNGPGSPETILDEADRERLAEALKRHAVEGRLDFDELGERLDRLYRAANREEAARVIADLPSLGPGRTEGRRGGGRRHGEAQRAESAWVPTAERFRDPTSARIMRVWVDPLDASRHYVPEDGS